MGGAVMPRLFILTPAVRIFPLYQATLVGYLFFVISPPAILPFENFTAMPGLRLSEPSVM